MRVKKIYFHRFFADGIRDYSERVLTTQQNLPVQLRKLSIKRRIKMIRVLTLLVGNKGDRDSQFRERSPAQKND